SDPGESYELDLNDDPAPPVASPPPTAKTAGKCPACGAAVKPTAVICIDCGYNFKTGRKLESPAADVEPAESDQDSGEIELADDDLVPQAPPPRPAAAPSTLLMGGRSAVAKALDEGE